MRDIFLATPYSKHVDYETRMVRPEFRARTESILLSLRTVGNFTVFCALEHEDWRLSDEPAEVGVRKDLDEIQASAALVAVLDEDPSAGAQYEMGFAEANDKPVIAATQRGTKLAYFNQGLADLGKIDHVIFKDPDHLTRQLAYILRPAEI